MFPGIPFPVGFSTLGSPDWGLEEADLTLKLLPVCSHCTLPWSLFDSGAWVCPAL
jgi:hypothetical protein